MGLMDFISKQFIDVIEMPQMEAGCLVKKFPMQDQEIQNGAVLVVRESQIAVFLNEGQIADVFKPGTHKLTTSTLPVLTNLRNWDKLFASPFKSDVYFFNTRIQIDCGWGTGSPVTVRDSEFGAAQVRAYGKYSYRLADPAAFFSNVAGTVDEYHADALSGQLRNLAATHFGAFLAQSGIPFLDMAANTLALADLVKNNLASAFAALGLEIASFTIESLNLPETLQKALEAKMSMGAVGDLSKYAQFQAAQSLTIAAANEGGLAGAGAGLGAGIAMAQQMAQALGSHSQAPCAAPAGDLEERLAKAKSMLDKGLIEKAEYDKLKADILAKLAG